METKYIIWVRASKASEEYFLVVFQSKKLRRIKKQNKKIYIIFYPSEQSERGMVLVEAYRLEKYFRKRKQRDKRLEKNWSFFIILR